MERLAVEDGSWPGPNPAHRVGTKVRLQGNGEAMPGCLDSAQWYPEMSGPKGTGTVIA